MKFIYFNQKYYSDVPEMIDDKIVTIPEPWLIYNNSLFRKICHVWLSPRLNSCINIPLKSIWIHNIITKLFDRKDEVCIIVNAHFYPLFYGGLIKHARKYFDRVFFVFIFSDRINMFQKLYKGFPDIEKLKKEFDLVITYNVSDAKEYNLILDRPCFPKYNYKLEVRDEYSSDVFFVGKSKERLKKIYGIYDKCVEHGLNCSFFITDVPFEKQRLDTNIIFNVPISYEEVLLRSYNTKCILNIIQDGGAGVTLRDYETILLKKIELTDNTALEVTGLYDSKQIIWLDEFEDRWEDIVSGFQGTERLVQKFSQEEWYKWIEKKILGELNE